LINVAVDLGSRFIKIFVCEDGSEVFRLEDTVGFYKNHLKRENGNVAIDTSFLNIDTKYARILTTGYGRNLLTFSNSGFISEIKAHFYGAKYQSGESDFVLIDIGGQDSKVIQAVDGYINDFTMNDKCAASSGRFIEHAAEITGVTREEAAGATDSPVCLTDTCAVFCESEIIGHIARGVPILHLAAGVNLSVARRIAPAVKKYNPKRVFASGGVSSSPALIHFLSELTGIKTEPLPNPHFNGAIGCMEYMKRTGR
jgi:predicted CoA-substrate-specific enzyme activase